MKYCLECGWTASPEDGHTRVERSELAIDHFLRTGHTIASVPSPPPTS